MSKYLLETLLRMTVMVIGGVIFIALNDCIDIKWQYTCGVTVGYIAGSIHLKRK